MKARFSIRIPDLSFKLDGYRRQLAWSWKRFQQQYSQLVERFPFVPLGLTLAGILIIAYYAFVTAASISIYRYGEDNAFTATAERIFPYPAIFAGSQSFPLKRVRLEVDARRTFTTRQGLHSSDAEIQDFVVQQLINRSLYAQAAQQRGIVVTDADIDQKMQTLYDKVGGEENFRKFLHDNYGDQINIPQFRIWTKELLYEAAIQYQVLTRATVRHILFAVPENAIPEQVEAVRQRAESIRTQITDTSKFGEFANQYSDDENSRDKGGSLGTTLRGNDAPVLSQEFEDAIFSVPVGQVSAPVRTPQGWHLVLVDKREGDVNESLQQFTNELRAKGHIKVLVSLQK